MAAERTGEEIAGDVLSRVLRFGRALREAGLRTDLRSVLQFSRSLAIIDIGRREEVYDAGVACFVNRPEDRSVYDAVFDRFWFARSAERAEPEPSHGHGAGSDRDLGSGAERDGERSRTGDRSAVLGEPALQPADRGEAGQPTDSGAVVTYSAAEVLRTKAFDKMSPEEIVDASRLINHLQPRLAQRRTRRFRVDRRGRSPAPRALLRRSLGTGGYPMAWLGLRHRTRPRQIVTICDVSGSMDQYSRFVLRFAHALTRLDVRTESFVFGTRLTRITPQLRRRNVDEALANVAEAVRDWAGGTQIGSALRSFNRGWARRVVRSSGIVIIVSDGWDRGDPQIVGDEMALLRRRCHRVVWLNPLASTQGYEPRTAGMVAALPFIDDFLGMHNVRSLERLAELL